MDKKPETLQSYADKHCGGDRCMAMHRLLFTGGDGTLDYYVREMTAEETNFVTAMVQLQDIRAFGGEANFQSVLKAEKLAASLEVSTKDIREGMENPFRKNLRKELLKLAAAVVLPAVGALVLKLLGYGYEWLFAVQAILVGLGAMNTAAALLLFFRYRKLEKLVAQLPQPQPTDTYPNLRRMQSPLYRPAQPSPRRSPRNHGGGGPRGHERSPQDELDRPGSGAGFGGGGRGGPGGIHCPGHWGSRSRLCRHPCLWLLADAPGLEGSHPHPGRDLRHPL